MANQRPLACEVYATGKRSQIAVDMETYSLWTLRDGKVLRWEGFSSEAEALEAAGLSE